MRYLININDGTIYEWNEFLAVHPSCRECTEEEAFPEKFIPKSARGRVPKVTLQTPDIPAEEDTSNPEVDADASRGLPK